MSSARKTILIIATILVIGGAAISFGAFAAAGFTPKGLSTDARDWASTTHTFTPEAQQAHTSLAVHDPRGSVRFEETNADAIEVTYWESTEEGKSLSLSDEQGAIVIEAPEPTNWAGNIGFMVNLEDRSTVVKIPQSFKGTITTAEGTVDLAQATNLQDALANASNNPEVPETPDAPEAPEAPETPEAPDAPEAPEAPATPAAPAA